MKRTAPLFFLLCFASTHSVAAFEYELISRTPEGVASEDSHYPQLSGAGNLVVFSSNNPKLVENDLNGVEDVFLYNLTDRVLSRISVSSDNVEANGANSAPYITSNELYVVFESLANNLHVSDDNNSKDIFRRSLTSGTTTHASLGPVGIVGRSATFSASISENGIYTAFASQKDDLIFIPPPRTPSYFEQVFWYDAFNVSLRHISLGTDGEPANGPVRKVQISGNGNYIVFDSYSSNLFEGYINTPLSVGSIVFTPHVYLYDVSQGSRTVISSDEYNNFLDSFASSPTISEDGRYVAFAVVAKRPEDGTYTEAPSGLYLYDRLTQTTQRINFADSHIRMPYISPNGRYITYYTTDKTSPSPENVPQFSVVLLDMQTQKKYQTGPVALYKSVNDDKKAPYTFPFGLKVSVDNSAQNLVFTSNINGLIPTDQNNVKDIYLHQVPRTELNVQIESVQDQQIGEFSQVDQSTWLEYKVEILGNLLPAPTTNKLNFSLSTSSRIMLVKEDTIICQTVTNYSQFSCKLDQAITATQPFIATLYLYPEITGSEEFSVSAELTHDALEDNLTDNTVSRSSTVTKLQVTIEDETVVTIEDEDVVIIEDESVVAEEGMQDTVSNQDSGSGSLGILSLAVILLLGVKRRQM